MTVHYKDKSFNIPYHPKEIKFADYCDFRARDISWLSKHDEYSEEDKAGFIIDSVSHLIDIPRDLPFSTLDDETAKGLILKGEQLSILRIYIHLLTVINTETQEEYIKDGFYQFTHKGETFRLKGEIEDWLAGGGLFDVGETVETLEIERHFGRMRTDAEANGANYLSLSNLDMELDLSKFALLVRKEDEPLPMRTFERQAFIHERSRFFADLPLDIVNGVNFFLRVSLAAFALRRINQLSINTSFTAES